MPEVTENATNDLGTCPPLMLLYMHAWPAHEGHGVKLALAVHVQVIFNLPFVHDIVQYVHAHKTELDRTEIHYHVQIRKGGKDYCNQ